MDAKCIDTPIFLAFTMVPGVRELFWSPRNGNGPGKICLTSAVTTAPDASPDRNDIFVHSRNVFDITLYEQYLDPC